MVARHEAQAEFLQAVGQATRLRILEVLADGERCVCDIQAAIGEQQSNVSKHLAILRRSGVLTAHREGEGSYTGSGVGVLRSSSRDCPTWCCGIFFGVRHD